MTAADKLRLARQIQFRELLTLIFNDDSPWGESLPLQALADHLEQDGHQAEADAIRGRLGTLGQDLQVVSHRVQTDAAPIWSATDQGRLRNRPTGRAIRQLVELVGTIDLLETA